jgi:hypothetical protein
VTPILVVWAFLGNFFFVPSRMEPRGPCEIAQKPAQGSSPTLSPVVPCSAPGASCIVPCSPPGQMELSPRRSQQRQRGESGKRRQLEMEGTDAQERAKTAFEETAERASRSALPPLPEFHSSSPISLSASADPPVRKRKLTKSDNATKPITTKPRRADSSNLEISPDEKNGSPRYLLRSFGGKNSCCFRLELTVRPFLSCQCSLE